MKLLLITTVSVVAGAALVFGANTLLLGASGFVMLVSAWKEGNKNASDQ